MFFSKIFCNSDDEMQLNEVLILSGDDRNWTKTTMKYAKLVENDLLTLSMGMGLELSPFINPISG